MVQREVIFNVKCQFEQMQTVIFGKDRTMSDYIVIAELHQYKM